VSRHPYRWHLGCIPLNLAARSSPTGILEHDCNIGYHDCALQLKSVDGVEIPNLMALAEKLAAVLKDEDGEKFVCFRFELDSDDDEEGSDVPDFVLERSKVAAANAQICKQNRIADIASERLRAPFREG